MTCFDFREPSLPRRKYASPRRSYGPFRAELHHAPYAPWPCSANRVEPRIFPWNQPAIKHGKPVQAEQRGLGQRKKSRYDRSSDDFRCNDNDDARNFVALGDEPKRAQFDRHQRRAG